MDVPEAQAQLDEEGLALSLRPLEASRGLAGDLELRIVAAVVVDPAEGDAAPGVRRKGGVGFEPVVDRGGAVQRGANLA